MIKKKKLYNRIIKKLNANQHRSSSSLFLFADDDLNRIYLYLVNIDQQNDEISTQHEDMIRFINDSKFLTSTFNINDTKICLLRLASYPTRIGIFRQ